MIESQQQSASLSPQTAKHKNDKKQFYISQTIFWLYHFSVFLCAILLIVYAQTQYQTVQSITSTAAYFRAQQTMGFWSMGQIIDIRSVSTMNCPQGYEPLISYQWAGTLQGCKCPVVSASYYYEIVLKGSCDLDLVDLNCTNVEAQSPLQMPFWKGDQLMCVKRIDQLNFYNSTFSADTNSQICANNTNYQISTLKNVSCPITNISNQTFASASQTILVDSKTNYTLFSIAQGGYPIIDFKMSEYSFCQNYSLPNITPNKTGNYILESVQIEYCPNTDPRIVSFDSTDEQTLITNNNNVNRTISQLPSYPRPSSSYRYYLGYVSYPPWSYACRISSNLNLNLANQHLLLYDETYISNNIRILVTTLSVFTLLFRMFYCVRRYRELKIKAIYGNIFDSEQELINKIPNLNYRHNRLTELLLIVVDVGIRFSMFCSAMVAVNRFSNFSVWFKSAQNCTDSFISDVILTVYLSSITTSYYHIVRLAVIVMVCMVADALHITFRVLGGDLKKGSTVKNQSDSEPKIVNTQNQNLNEDKEMDVQVLVLEEDDDRMGATKANFHKEEEVGVTKLKKSAVKKRIYARRRNTGQQQQ